VTHAARRSAHTLSWTTLIGCSGAVVARTDVNPWRMVSCTPSVVAGVLTLVATLAFGTRLKSAICEWHSVSTHEARPKQYNEGGWGGGKRITRAQRETSERASG